MMRKILVLIAVGLLSLAFAASAFGQSATEDAYGGTAGVQHFGGGGGNGSNAVLAADNTSSGTSSSGSLPFTGLDVGLIVLAGVALVGTGLVVRRSTRHDSA